MKHYQALQVKRQGESQTSAHTMLEQQPLKAGQVLIKLAYSSINYKDALGVLGQGSIFKRFPIVPGIDGAGYVEASHDGSWPTGLAVLVTGCGLGETQDGGFAEYMTVPADWVVPLPDGLSLQEAMIIGTAGFTAALCLHRMEENGQSPRLGPLVVTGASGGVGSMAINIFANQGYEVIALSSKQELKDYLCKLGAKAVISREEAQFGKRPLETARWAGAIDNVGGEVLTGLLSSIKLWGNVAAVGLAGSASLTTTVMPFILRGVSLLGISSANCPQPLRHKLWQRLASDLKPSCLNMILQEEVPLSQIEGVCQRLLARKGHGRYLVKCSES